MGERDSSVVGEMKNSVIHANDSAVSEIIGGLLIVFIAIVVSISIYAQVLPVPIPSPEPNIHLMGYVTEDGTAIVEHMGGETLYSYEIFVSHSNDTINKTTIYKYTNSPWEIGETKSPSNISIFEENNTIRIIVYCIYDDDSRHMAFDSGCLKKGELQEYRSTIHPMLISTLRTNTIDEDLICYNCFFDPDINASTYIYKWIVDSESLAEVLMPFDTNNTTTTKDYSGNGYNGTVTGPTWTEEGKVGGAYYFGGASDYIDLSLPNNFDDFSINDFTISVWVKSDDITDDHRVVLQGGNDDDFALMFQFDNEIHFGVSEGGIKRALRTGNLSSNTWYHITGVWDASEKSVSLYHNGSNCTETGYRTYAQGTKDGFDIGHGTTSSRFWFGFIDELQIYDRAFSADQIYQMYRRTNVGCYNKSVIVSEETVLNNIWQCIIFPNDGTQDGTAIESNVLEIKTYGGGE